MFKTFLSLMLLSFLFSSCSSVKTKNINYAGNTDPEYSLNIYSPKNAKQNDVIVFVHGGSWSSGKKETYWWLGRNFARKGIVTVIINYPLAPKVTFGPMALATAQSVKWVQDSIAKYGGNPDRLFLMGHSAGGHLVELINSDPQYYKKVGIKNPAKGIILDDPFGLDMYEYLVDAEKDDFYVDFMRSFTKDPANWKLGSPLRYAENIKNPHIMFYGSKTYGAIQIQTPKLYNILKNDKVPVEIHEIKGKSHVPMIAQMIFGGNQLYGYILDFIKRTK